MKKLILFLFIILTIITSARTIYVKAGSSSTNNGTSWTDAYPTLQSALDAAASSDQIWVSKGTYRPTSFYSLSATDPRNKHFEMKEGVAVYGGFAGSEGLLTERSNYGSGGVNETILCGDPLGNDNFSASSGYLGGTGDDNCYHVFYHAGISLSSTALLDGFTIKGGNANKASNPFGGGILNYLSSPEIRNCVFTSNSAGISGSGGGSAVYNFSSVALITNCSFISNFSIYGTIYNYSHGDTDCIPIINGCIFSSNYADYGAGICNYAAKPLIKNCIFSSNTASRDGGGMYNYSSFTIPEIINCIFTGNSAENCGGAIYNHEVQWMIRIKSTTISGNTAPAGGGIYSVSTNLYFQNSILWANIALNGNELYVTGTENNFVFSNSCFNNSPGNLILPEGFAITSSSCINTDPLFVNAPGGDYRITGNSPCTDAGNNSYNQESYDVRGAGFSRMVNKNTGAAGTIDIGGFEYIPAVDPLPVELVSFGAVVDNSSVLLTWQTAAELNNYGFEVERSTQSSSLLNSEYIPDDEIQESTWKSVAFIPGHGNSNSVKQYSYIDDNLRMGQYLYRLKQIDNDGIFKYSEPVSAAIYLPKSFVLMQNYPNPFNPSTTITFCNNVYDIITLTIYDISGAEVKTLLNEYRAPGWYTIYWNGMNKYDSPISSGSYFYRLTSGSDVKIRKMLLLK